MYDLRPAATPIRVQVVGKAIPAWGIARLVESAHPRLVLAGTSEVLEPPAGSADIVVLDLDFADHPDPVAALRQHTHAPVIVLTGDGDEACADRAVISGARGVVHKRNTTDTLLQAIEQVHAGQMWLSPQATTRIVTALTRHTLRRPGTPEEARIAALSDKERQTITVLVTHASSRGKQLADTLHISEHTLRNRLTGIYAKLGVSNRMDLFAYAQRHGIRA